MKFFRYFRSKKNTKSKESSKQEKNDYSNFLFNSLLLELILVRTSEYYSHTLKGAKKDLHSNLIVLATYTALVTQITSLFWKSNKFRTYSVEKLMLHDYAKSITSSYGKFLTTYVLDANGEEKSLDLIMNISLWVVLRNHSDIVDQLKKKYGKSISEFNDLFKSDKKTIDTLVGNFSQPINDPFINFVKSFFQATLSGEDISLFLTEKEEELFKKISSNKVKFSRPVLKILDDNKQNLTTLVEKGGHMNFKFDHKGNLKNKFFTLPVEN